MPPDTCSIPEPLPPVTCPPEPKDILLQAPPAPTQPQPQPPPPPPPPQPQPPRTTDSSSNPASTASPAASDNFALHQHDDDNLPPTKIKRKYLCKMCQHQTWNPREHFRHRIALHNQKIRVVKCPLCVYACQYRQKLNRHLKLVHHILPHEIPKRFDLANPRTANALCQLASTSSSSSLADNHSSSYRPSLLPQHLNLDEINSYYSRMVPVRLNSSPVDLSFPEEVKQSIKVLEYLLALCLYGPQ